MARQGIAQSIELEYQRGRIRILPNMLGSPTQKTERRGFIPTFQFASQIQQGLEKIGWIGLAAQGLPILHSVPHSLGQIFELDRRQFCQGQGKMTRARAKRGLVGKNFRKSLREGLQGQGRSGKRGEFDVLRRTRKDRA